MARRRGAKQTHRRVKKAFQVMALCVVTSICIRFAAVNEPFTVFATSETKKALEDAKQEREDLQNELDEKNEDIDDLKSTQSDLKSELSDLNTQLSDVSNNLARIEADIDAKKTEIEETQAQLEAAMQTEADQYAAMKKRIQFIYESQDRRGDVNTVGYYFYCHVIQQINACIWIFIGFGHLLSRLL